MMPLQDRPSSADKSVKPARDTRLSKPFLTLLSFSLACTFLAGCGSPGEGITETADAAPRAAVVKVTRRNLANHLEIASEFLPFQEIDVYAKVSGYIKKSYIDWGTRVKQGQLLAVLEIPELEQQIQHDQAAVEQAAQDLNRAQSSYAVAHITYQRLAGVQKNRPELISQEDIDVAQGKDLEGSAAVSGAKQALLAAKAALEKDKTLYGYAQMTAPFDGVVTKVYAFTGALLPDGTSSDIGNSALCHLSQNDLLRLVIPVPERAVPDIHIGESVAVEVSALNKMFDGKIVRFSDSIDLTTRTMHTEVQVPNPNYEIVPGMYANVEIPIHSAQNALTLPVQAVQNSGAGHGQVLVVDADNRIEQRQVTLGLQTADEIEVVSGVKEGEMVIFGEQVQFKPGQSVTPDVIDPSKLE